MRIGIIIGSLRNGRKGEAVGSWVFDAARENTDADWELIDLRAFDVPLLTSAIVPGDGDRTYEDERVSAWSAAIDACDGFIFVTPEYNHGVPGGFKNAVDSLGPEWYGKAVSFVSYGFEGGVRSVESWRVITANLSMASVRNTVSLQTRTDWRDGTFQPEAFRERLLARVIADTVAATRRNLENRR